jgi:hypothetical protein
VPSYMPALAVTPNKFDGSSADRTRAYLACGKSLKIAANGASSMPATLEVAGRSAPNQNLGSELLNFSAASVNSMRFRAIQHRKESPRAVALIDTVGSSIRFAS